MEVKRRVHHSPFMDGAILINLWHIGIKYTNSNVLKPLECQKIILISHVILKSCINDQFNGHFRQQL